jgi:hypothetical protein
MEGGCLASHKLKFLKQSSRYYHDKVISKTSVNIKLTYGLLMSHLGIF